MAVAHIVELSQPPRKRWTRARCELLTAAGFFDRYRCELIEGMLLSKSNDSEPHLVMLAELTAWFGERFPARGMVACPLESPVYRDLVCPPHPDLMVTKRPMDFGRNGWPRPADVELVIEVAEEDRLAFDTTTKAEIYARAGIADYWVVDVNARRLMVFREPRDGEYQAIHTLAAPDAVLNLNDILPTEN